MIRLAHISDSHFDSRGRLKDVIAVHRAFLEQAAAAKVDIILHAGDWFERGSSPAERLALAEFLREAAIVAPVFGVKGNHDAELDLSLFPLLDAPGHVEIVDRPGTLGRASIINIGDGRELALIGLPWFDKAHIVSMLDASFDIEATRQHTIEAARGLLDALRHEADRVRGEGAIPILVGHVLVQGSETSTGQTLIGTTVELAPSEILAVGCAYAALGHVHLSQSWFEGRVAYSGSPNRCNYGESEAKGWRLVTLTDEGEFVSNEFRELPARPILLLEIDFTEPQALEALRAFNDTGLLAGHRDFSGALVRYRYRIAAPDLHLIDAASIEKRLLDYGAAEAKVEAVVVSATRTRAPEIVKAQSLSEKVDQYIEAKEISIDEPTRDRLHAKVGQLEGQASA